MFWPGILQETSYLIDVSKGTHRENYWTRLLIATQPQHVACRWSSPIYMSNNKLIFSSRDWFLPTKLYKAIFWPICLNSRCFRNLCKENGKYKQYFLRPIYKFVLSSAKVALPIHGVPYLWFILVIGSSLFYLFRIFRLCISLKVFIRFFTKSNTFLDLVYMWLWVNWFSTSLISIKQRIEYACGTTIGQCLSHESSIGQTCYQCT